MSNLQKNDYIAFEYNFYGGGTYICYFDEDADCFRSRFVDNVSTENKEWASRGTSALNDLYKNGNVSYKNYFIKIETEKKDGLTSKFFSPKIRKVQSKYPKYIIDENSNLFWFDLKNQKYKLVVVDKELMEHVNAIVSGKYGSLGDDE